jgi:hypothetical protein
MLKNIVFIGINMKEDISLNIKKMPIMMNIILVILLEMVGVEFI